MKLLCRLEGQPRTIASTEVEGRTMKQITEKYAQSRRIGGDLGTLQVLVQDKAGAWWRIAVSAWVMQHGAKPVKIEGPK